MVIILKRTSYEAHAGCSLGMRTYTPIGTHHIYVRDMLTSHYKANDIPYMVCLSSEQRGLEAKWDFKGTFAFTSLAEARAQCTGYEYMALECPQSTGYEIWCANAWKYLPAVEKSRCEGAHPAPGHCTGPFKYSNSFWTGGYHSAAVYRVAN